MGSRSVYLQLRITPTEKRQIMESARGASVTMSEWIRSRLLSDKEKTFVELVGDVANPSQRQATLAELNEFLLELSPKDFERAVSLGLSSKLSAYDANYIAAMVEVAAHQKKVLPPKWTTTYSGMDTPVFGSPLVGLRLHLLSASPPPFRRRNIFIDSTVGDRV